MIFQMHPPKMQCKFCFGVEQAFMFDVLSFEEKKLREMSVQESTMGGIGWAVYDRITRQQHEVWNVPKHPIFQDPYHTSYRDMQLKQLQQSRQK